MSHPALERVVLASANPHKVEELSALLEGVATIVPRPASAPETVEDADSLEGNAKKKAREITQLTSLPAVADDTGLFVAHLNGRPGVLSARYAGPAANSDDNVSKLLGEMEGATDRSATFRTVIALVWPTGEELTVRGEVSGVITTARQGNGGFGYDCVFAPEEAFQGPTAVTFAEMTTDQKHAISHRGRALKALKQALKGPGILVV